MKTQADPELLRDTLANTFPFAAAEAATRNRLCRVAGTLAVPMGGLAFREGDASPWAFILHSGALQASAADDRGQAVALRVLRAGDIGGLTRLDREEGRSASMLALEPSLLVTLPKQALREALGLDPAFAAALLTYFGNHLRARTRQLAAVTARSRRDAPPQIAFFDAKPYERRAFERHLGADLAVQWIVARLDADTAALADGVPIVCAFVNDRLDDRVVTRLAAGGTRHIALRCAGYNHVDLASAARNGLSVTRVPAYSPHAVAEHAVALLLTLNRKTHRAYLRVREGNFSLSGLEGFDLHGRCAGIVGLGKIGRCLARILRGFGMTVLAADAQPDAGLAERIGLQYVELDELLARSDVISLHAPLLPATYHLIDARRIAQMKPGVVLINTSRGGLVDAKALVDGLKSGRIGAAGLDVYEEESEYFFQDRSDRPIDDDLLARLMTFPNVLITSHQGFLTEDALDNIAQTTLANCREWLAGRRGDALTHALPAPAAPPPVSAGS